LHLSSLCNLEFLLSMLAKSNVADLGKNCRCTCLSFFFLRVERKYNTRTAATATMTLSIKTAVLAPGDLDAVDATFPPVLPSICEECK